MVDSQLKTRHINDPATLLSMSDVPRHLFVPPQLTEEAYSDKPLPIDGEQTISQPYIVALMTQAAQVGRNDKVLDVGTGSGYAAAVFSRIAQAVFSIERLPELAENATRLFNQLGYANIFVKVGDGTLGWQEHAPYDAICVTAASPAIPKELIAQLKDGGRLVIPIGDRFSQELIKITKAPSGTFIQEHLQHVRFVPLIGEEGWSPS